MPDGDNIPKPRDDSRDGNKLKVETCMANSVVKHSSPGGKLFFTDDPDGAGTLFVSTGPDNKSLSATIEAGALHVRVSGTSRSDYASVETTDLKKLTNMSLSLHGATSMPIAVVQETVQMADEIKECVDSSSPATLKNPFPGFKP